MCVSVNKLIAQRKEKIAKAQSYVRGYLTRKRVTKQLHNFRKLNCLASRIRDLKALCGGVENGKKAEFEAKADDLTETSKFLIAECKANATTPNEKHFASTVDLEKELDGFVQNLKYVYRFP